MKSVTSLTAPKSIEIIDAKGPETITTPALTLFQFHCRQISQEMLYYNHICQTLSHLKRK